MNNTNNTVANKLSQLETLLNKECPKYETNCNTCPYSNECDEYEKLSNQ